MGSDTTPAAATAGQKDRRARGAPFHIPNSAVVTAVSKSGNHSGTVYQSRCTTPRCPWPHHEPSREGDDRHSIVQCQRGTLVIRTAGMDGAPLGPVNTTLRKDFCYQDGTIIRTGRLF